MDLFWQLLNLRDLSLILLTLHSYLVVRVSDLSPLYILWPLKRKTIQLDLFVFSNMILS